MQEFMVFTVVHILNTLILLVVVFAGTFNSPNVTFAAFLIVMFHSGTAAVQSFDYFAFAESAFYSVL